MQAGRRTHSNRRKMRTPAPEVKSLKGNECHINELPDGVLSHIISLLPLKEAVRTSILSKRWRYLCASISNINFEFDAISIANELGFMDFLDRLFISSGRLPLHKFRLNCIRYLTCREAFRLRHHANLDPARLKRWVCAAIGLGIQEIYLTFRLNQLLLPSSLFTCTTLVALRLRNDHSASGFQVPAKVWLPSLKILDLNNSMCFSSDDSAERLFSNCPVLEDLVISSYMGGSGKGKLIVSNSTLKRLTIESVNWRNHSSFEIVINAPNLVYFKYAGCEENSHVLLNMQSLAEANIDFQANVLDQNNVHSAIALMRGISNIHTLHLTSATLLCFEELGVPIPLFPNLTILRISFWEPFLGFPGLPNLLAQSHHLEILVLELRSGEDINEPLKWNPDPWYELKDSGASCLLSLKAIEIQSFDGSEDELKMVEYFLENATLLEKLKIQIWTEIEKQFLISKELLAHYQEPHKNAESLLCRHLHPSGMLNCLLLFQLISVFMKAFHFLVLDIYRCSLCNIVLLTAQTLLVNVGDDILSGICTNPKHSCFIPLIRSLSFSKCILSTALLLIPIHAHMLYFLVCFLCLHIYIVE